MTRHTNTAPEEQLYPATPIAGRPPFRAILFDLDGTLVNTMHLFAHIAADILHRYASLSIDTAKARYLETSGIPFLRQLELIVPGGSQIEQMGSEFESRKLAASEGVVMTDATIQTLIELKQCGLGIAISSNNYQENVEHFSHSSPIQFDFALGYTSRLRKGIPHIAYALRYYGCPNEELLFVGDSLSDAAMAESCHLSFVAVTTTVGKAAFMELNSQIKCVANLSELPRLLGLKSGANPGGATSAY